MKRVVSSTNKITSNIIEQPNNSSNAHASTINQANNSNSTINQANFDDTEVQHVEPQEIVMLHTYRRYAKDSNTCIAECERPG